jgi:hypothetical protein
MNRAAFLADQEMSHTACWMTTAGKRWRAIRDCCHATILRPGPTRSSGTVTLPPPPLRIAAHVRDSPLADLGGEHRAKPVLPEPHGLMADVDPALRLEIFDIAQRRRVSHIPHHHQANDFWRAVEIPERVAHGSKLPQPGKAQEIGLTEPAGLLGLSCITDQASAPAFVAIHPSPKRNLPCL